MAALPKTNGFVRLDHNFVRSDPVVALSSHGKALLLAMADRYNGRNNGRIPFSYDEARRWLHCSSATAKRTFGELKVAGLIEVVQPGSFYGRQGAATEWRLIFYK